jgi:hypothetical protein
MEGGRTGKKFIKKKNKALMWDGKGSRRGYLRSLEFLSISSRMVIKLYAN